MKFIKKHKFTTFIIVVFVVGVIILHYLFNLFFINSGKPEYGNRLDGIETVQILDKDLTNIKDALKKKSDVKKVGINISGRTLDVVITVDDKMSIKDAKNIGKESYSYLTDKQIEYYSVQVFVKKDSKEKNDFPIIGYKQKGTKNLVWTKDRKVTKTDEAK